MTFTLQLALENGQVECFVYAYENGCPINIESFTVNEKNLYKMYQLCTH